MPQSTTDRRSVHVPTTIYVRLDDLVSLMMRRHTPLVVPELAGIAPGDQLSIKSLSRNVSGDVMSLRCEVTAVTRAQWSDLSDYEQDYPIASTDADDPYTRSDLYSDDWVTIVEFTI